MTYRFCLLRLTLVTTLLSCFSDYYATVDAIIASVENVGNIPVNVSTETTSTKSDRIEVVIWPQLYSIADIDEKIGTITYIQWLTMTWKADQSFARNNSAPILVNFNEIWVPDIVILNAMRTEKTSGLGTNTDMVKVYGDGRAVASFSHLITQRCHRFNLADFPFDTQRCSTRFASWTLPSERLKLTPYARDITDQFRKHSEWILEETRPKRAIEIYNNILGQKSSRDEIVYDFVLRRKPDHFMFTVAIPCFIITSLSIVGLFAPFSSTGERQEKVSLGLNTLLAVTVLLLMIAEEMPRSMDGESQPLLSKYILAEMFLCIAATCTTVVILAIHRSLLNGRMHCGGPAAVTVKRMKKLMKCAADETSIWVTNNSRKCYESETMASLMSKLCKDEEAVRETNRFFFLVDGACMAFFLLRNAILTKTMFY